MREEEQAVIPAKENFSLLKVKLQRGGGLDVHYDVMEVVGNENYTNKYHVSSAKDIHPDLRNLFKDLCPIMGRMFNFTSFKTMIASTDFKATREQAEFADAFAEECIGNIEVTGVSLSGHGDGAGVVLTGLLTVSGSHKTKINTPLIRCNVEEFGFEEELKNIVCGIESEIYGYLFEGKKGKLELFGADGTGSEYGRLEL